MNQELPKIANSVYGASTHHYDPNEGLLIDNSHSFDYIDPTRWKDSKKEIDPVDALKILGTAATRTDTSYSSIDKLLQGKLHMPKVNEESRRYVQVFVVDADSKIPLSKAVLYKGEPQMTDLSNEELFFTIPMMDLLKAHNEFRKSHVVEDEFVSTEKSRKRHLKPIRIKDLSMTVVTIAQF